MRTLSLGGLFILAVAGEAAAPANDAFADRIVLTGLSTSTSGSNIDATHEEGEPLYDGKFSTTSVWWSWTAPASGPVVIDTIGSDFDTLLGGFLGSEVNNGLATVDADDDGGGYPASLIAFDAVARTTYQIGVAGWSSGSGFIFLSLNQTPAPLFNDNFAARGLLTGTSDTFTISNVGATHETGEPAHAGNTAGRSLWWTWTAPFTGEVTIDTAGSSLDTVLGVYTGSGLADLELVASNDDDGSVHTSQVSFVAIEGTGYQIAVDGYDGAEGQVNCSLTLSPELVMLTQPSSLVVMAGQTATFTAEAGGAPDVTYQWYKGEGLIEGATAASYTIPEPTPDDAGIYLVVVSNSDELLISDVAYLTVNAPPAITAQPVGSTVTTGSQVSFTVTATGSPSPTYQWRKGGVDIPGATAATYTIPYTMGSDAGSYDVVVTNAVDSVASVPVNLALIGPTISAMPSSRQNVLAGQALTLSVTATGSPAPTYQWKRNGRNVVNGGGFSGATTSSLSITGSSPLLHNGWYQLFITNGQGTSTTAPVFVHVAPNPSQVVAWGSNSYGQVTVPPGLNDGVEIATGGTHAAALKSDGTVVAWGYNAHGQATVPVGLNNVVAIAAGGYHTVALKSDRTVVAWGADSYGESTVPDGLNNVVAIAAGSSHTVALKSDGTVEAWGANNYGQSTVQEELSNVVAVAAGGSHTVALKGDGTVVAWGANNYGQSTVPEGLNNVVAIAAGAFHTIALRSNGTVETWGSDIYGQKTVPGGLSNVVGVAAGTDHTLALKSDGTVTAWGANFAEQSTVPAGLGNVVAVEAGGYFSAVLRSSAGGTYFKPVAPGITTQPDDQFVMAGTTATFSVVATGVPAPTYQWRKNGTPIAGATGASLSIEAVSLSDAGSYYDVVVSNSAGSVESSDGYLAVGPKITTQPAGQTVAVGNPVVFSVGAEGSPYLNYQWRKGGIDIPGATGTAYAIASSVSADAGAYTVEVSNPVGSVISNVASLTVNLPAGYPQVSLVSSPVQVPGSGQNLVLSVTATGSPAPTYQWKRNGRNLANGGGFSGVTSASLSITGASPLLHNGWYQLAVTNSQGTVKSAPVFVNVAVSPTQLVAWGSNEYGQRTIPDGLGNVVAIAAGGSHAVALRADGTVAAWGDDYYGQCAVPGGLSGVVAIAAGSDHTVALQADGTVVAWGGNYSGQSSVPAGLAGVVAIAAGADHTVALRADGTVVAWGNNYDGQTAGAVSATNVVGIAAGGYHTVALRADGTVVAWGANEFGQSNVPDGLTNVVGIAAGWHQGMALKADGTVVGWGGGYYGQSAVPDGLSGVAAIAAGGGHTVALKSNGTVVAWGDDYYGQSSVPDGLANVLGIAGGGLATVALRNATGGNYVRPLGDSQITDYGPGGVTAGTTVTFSIIADGQPTFVWDGGGTVTETYDSSNDSTTSTMSLTPMSGGFYTYNAEVTNGDETSNHNFNLTVRVPPYFTQSPESQTVSEGSEVFFWASAGGSTGFAGPSLQWQVSTDGENSWNDIYGQTGSSLYLPSVSAGMSGWRYRCVATVEFANPETAESEVAVLKVLQYQTTPLLVVAAPTQTYGTGQTLGTTGGNGSGAVTYQVVSGSGGTIDGNVLHANSGSGSVGIQAFKDGDDTHVAASSGTFVVTFAPAKQDPITVHANPAVVAYGSQSLLSISGGANTGTPDYASTAGGQVAGATFTAVASSGTATVTATAPANANYQERTASTVIVLGPRALSVSGITAGNKPYDGSTVATLSLAGASLNGVINGDDVTLVTAGAVGTFATATVGDGKAVAVTGLTLAGPGAGHYVLVQPSLSANITKASQPAPTISSANSFTFGAGYTATANSGFGALEWALGTGSTATGAAINAASGAVTSAGVGTAVIKVRFAGDATHDASPYSGDFTVTINKAGQSAPTITSANSVAFGGAYTATAGAGFGALEWALGAGSTATGAAINGATGAVTSTGVGTVVIKVRFAGDATHTASAYSGDFTITVSQATQPAPVISSANAFVFGSSYTATANTGFGALQWTLGSGSTAAGAAINASTGVVTATGYGTVVIKARFAGDANHLTSAYTADFTVSVTKTTQPAPAISSPNTFVVGNSYTATANAGFGALEWALGTGSTATGAGINATSGAVTATSGGTVVIKARFAGDSGHEASPFSADFTVTVTKQSQSAPTISSANFFTFGTAYTATANSGFGALQWALGTGSTAAGAAINATSGAVASTGVGTVAIKVRFAGDATHNASAYTADFTITVNKASQLPPAITGATAVAFGAPYTATANSGFGALEWTLGAGSNAPGAAIHPTSGAVTSTGIGTVVIKARFLGDATHNASGDSATFTVTITKAAQPAPVISLPNSFKQGEAYTATANTGFGALVWSLEPIGTTATGAAIDAASGAVTSSSAGLIMIRAQFAGDATHLASPTSAAFTLTVLAPSFDVMPSTFNWQGYLAANPDVAAVVGSDAAAAWSHYINYGIFEGRTDGDFNVQAYLAQYPNLAALFGTDLRSAAMHWYTIGRQQGLRIPNGFDVNGYFARNLDIAAYFGADKYGAWLHYYHYGVFEGRSFDTNFIPAEYLELNADLKAALGGDLQGATMHWLQYGHPIEDRMGRVPVGFNIENYFTRYPDLEAAFANVTPIAIRNVAVWNHYVAYGTLEGRSDGDFEANNYLATNPDLAVVFGTDVRAAALHWYFYGRREGRRIPPGFDVHNYRAIYPDLEVFTGDDLYGCWLHYRDVGVNEGRYFNNLFRPADYLALNPDVAAAIGNNYRDALLHWLYYGQYEGRQGKY